MARNGWLVLLVAGGVWWTGMLPVEAQIFPGSGNAFGSRGRFNAPPRAIAQRIREAGRAIEEERYGDAVVVLGDLLARETIAEQDADLAGQDFFLEADKTAGQVSRSLLREAEDTLGKLPPAGLEIYELRYGAKAQQMLATATAANDRKTLGQVVRRYSHTRAGRQAAWLAAALEISEGRPVAAVAILRRLAAQPAARKEFGSPLLVVLAEAEHLAGRTAAAGERLRAAEQAGWDVKLAAGKSTPPAAGDQTTWLAENFGSTSKARPQPEDATHMAHGGPAAIGPGAGSLPLSMFRWELPTSNSQKQQRALENFAATKTDSGLLPPAWFPIKVGSQLLMRTTERMMAVDFETGLRIWEYPWASSVETAEPEMLGGPMFMAPPQDASELLIQRVWNDLPYGRLSSDGERAFMLMDLGAVESIGLGPLRAQAIRPADTGSNTLVALELASEGKLLWKRGKSGNEPDENSLANAFFMGPPLPIDGLLYQMTELAGDTYLLCLDPRNGNELWRQQLLANEGGSIQSDPLRRVGGAMPSYSDGVLVCPTAGGALVAVDLTSRALLWGQYLPQNDTNVPMGRSRRSARGSDSLELMDRWYSGTPLIEDGKVIVTPIEMDALYGFDLLTGEQLWPRILRSGFSYLAGVRDGQFLLVAPQMVQAFDLNSGNPTWASPVTLDEEQQVTGTGVFGDGVYLLPTSGQEIWEINLSSGEVTQKRKVKFPLGNLLAVDGNIVSQTATQLTVAYSEDALRAEVPQRLADNPNDAWAMIRQGELLQEQGDNEQAIDWFMRARELMPTDEEVRSRLVEAMLTAIRNGKQPDQETTDLLESLIELNPQRVELLRLKTADALANQQGLQAIEHLLALAGIVLRDDRTQHVAQADMLFNGETTVASLDAWIAARAREAWEFTSPDQRPQITAMIDAFTAPMLGDPPSVQRRAVMQFGIFAGTDTILTGLFDTAVDDGAWAGAERYARQALRAAELQQDVTRQDRWRIALAELYLRAGFAADARQQLQQLTDSSRAETGELEETLTTMLTTPTWPGGVTMSASASENQNFARGNDRSPIEVVARHGEHLKNWHPQADQNGSILLRDPQGIDHPVRFDTGGAKNDMIQASIDGGLMILLMPDELIAIDLMAFQDRPIDGVLWRRPWKNQIDGNVRSRSAQTFFKHNTHHYILSRRRGSQLTTGVMRMGPIVGRRFFLLQDRDLIAIDATTNEELWRSENHAADTYLIADGNRVAAVSASTGVQVMRVEDGKLLETLPWEPSEQVFAVAGSHVLTKRNEPSEDDPEKYDRVVRLRAPLQDQVVLEVKVIDDENPNFEGAFAKLIDGQRMVMVTAEGRLLVWDLLRGVAIADHEVTLPSELSDINVITWEDAWIVAAVRREHRKTPEDSSAIGKFHEVGEHVDTDGPIFCINRSDGTLRWQLELDSPWGVTIDQAASSPLLFLSRSFREFSTTQKGTRTLDLLAIDTRTGEPVIRVDQMEVDSKFNNIGTRSLVAADLGVVDVRVENYNFLFRFADPPAAQLPLVYDSEDVSRMHEQAAEANAANQRDALGLPALAPLDGDGR